MPLFSKAVRAQVDAIAAKSRETLQETKKSKSANSVSSELRQLSKTVQDYFKDSKAICIRSKQELHDYVTKCIESGYAGIDTETTGLDRIHDWVVGASLYYPGENSVECYIPMKHLVPIFDKPYDNQLAYEEVGEEFQRLTDAKTKMIFANADFDLSMIWKDLKVDFNEACYFDVILAWRCLKENEPKNDLKSLYNKYVLKGKGDPKRFTDFFSPQLFPYCDPEVAKLYAANDPKITFELFKWQLKYLVKDNKYCKSHHLERIADLVWNVEFPLISVCQDMFRTGIYLDKTTAKVLQKRYHEAEDTEMKKLQDMVQEEIDKHGYQVTGKKMFLTGKEFNPKSPPQVNYLLYDLMKLPKISGGTGKEVLHDINLPITNQILKVRSLGVLINTFVDKMPAAVTSDSRIHAQFKQIGADCITGDSWIPTPSGYFTIAELCSNCDTFNDLYPVDDISIINKDQEVECASDCIKFENVVTLKVKTDLGITIEGTPHHPVLVHEDGQEIFKRLDELTTEDKLVVPTNYSKLLPTDYVKVEKKPLDGSIFPEYVDEDLAVVLGYFQSNDLNTNNPFHPVNKYQLDVIHNLLDDEVPTCICKSPVNVINKYIKYRIQLIEFADGSAETKQMPVRLAKFAHIHLLSQGVVSTLIACDTVLQFDSDNFDKYFNVIKNGETINHHNSQYVVTQVSDIQISHNDVYDFVVPKTHSFIGNGIVNHNTGRLSSASPNLMNIPSHATDIRHLFRATAAQRHSDKVKCENGTIKLSLPTCSKIIIDGKKIRIDDLQVGDTLSLISKEGDRQSFKVEIIYNENGTLTVTLISESKITDEYIIECESPAYVMMSSDYSAQEPRITAHVSQDPKMIDAFVHDKDVYGTIASVAFNLPYEQCLEFNPETHEYQAEGKKRRTECKSVLLGVLYGRSVPSIGDQLYGNDKSLTDEEKTAKAQEVYDAVMNNFPGLRSAMLHAQESARKQGFTETILGRRRHLPDMTLPEFEFKAMPGYINPDIDPLDPSTLDKRSDIPDRIIKQLTEEFSKFKYYRQIIKRTKQLEKEHIRFINNKPKINDAKRQCLNCVDFETEILTLQGFKRYDEVYIGDRILAFDIDRNEVVEDSVQDIIVSNEETEVIMFKSPTFDSASTLNHRWVVCESDESPRIKYTQNIYNNRWPDYPILRVADNSLSGIDWSDDYIHLLGWIMTDGSYSSQYYGIQLFQTTRREKNAAIYYAMIDLLSRLGIEYTDTCSDGYYHTIYLKKTEWLYKVFTEFSSRTLTFDFVSTLSQHQCEILMWAMIEGDGTSVDDGSNITFTCNTVQRRDVFQYIAFRAGYATNSYTTTAEQANRWTNGKLYDSLTNKNPVNVRHDYYTVSVLRFKRAQIYPHHKSKYTVPGVWCVTTNTHTWVARRNGKVYITGNSIIQGSAADQTKMAILLIANDRRWKEIGARILTPIHDEILVEAPIENREEAAKLLSGLMVEAADYLPFPSKCDVETTYRWYGLEAPCPYKKATSIDTKDIEEIKWLQYHLVEMEYLLPVIKDESGEARGNAAYGVNGIRTDEMEKAIFDYMSTRSVSSSEFIDRIEQEVSLGY